MQMNDSQNYSSIQLAAHYLSVGRPKDGLEALDKGAIQSADFAEYWHVRASLLLNSQ